MEEKTKTKIRWEFARKQQIRLKLIIIFIASSIIFGFPGILIGIYLDSIPILLGISILYIIANAALGIQYLVTWRCPSCQKLLGREMHIHFCPHCGAELA